MSNVRRQVQVAYRLPAPESEDVVSQDYKSPGVFKDRTILAVGVTVEQAQYLDLEKIAAAAFVVD